MTSETEPEGAQPAVPLIPDQPITTAAEDELGREPFIDALVRAIADIPAEEGLVLGLTGGWGEGKTSIINITCERLAESSQRPEIVRFNPWLFHGTPDLTTHFLTEFAAQLGGRDSRLRGVARTIARYGQLLAPIASAGLGPIGAAAGEAASAISRGLAPETSAETLRDQISEQLREAKTPVLVIIDDLDRLSAREIGDVVRLVKLVGDFPYVSYLMAFDRLRVEAALDTLDLPGQGREYLEKIVQVIYRLPPVDAGMVDTLLRRRLAESVGAVTAVRHDPMSFGSVWSSGFRDLFNTPRDVLRFSNALSIVLPRLAGEIELSDLLALEALRLFEPTATERLLAAPDILAGSGDIRLRTNESEDSARKRYLQEAFALANRPEIVESLARTLFPQLDRYLDARIFAPEDRSAWSRNLRVANPRVLMTYLQEALPAGVLPAAVVSAAYASMLERDAFRAVLDGTSLTDLPKLLSRLGEYEGEFAFAEREVPIEEIMRARARFPPERQGVLDGGIDLPIGRLIVRLLRDLDAREVDAVVKRLSAPELSSRADLLRLVGHLPNSGARLMTEEASQGQEEQLVEAILSATTQELVSERDLSHLINRAGRLRPTETNEKVRACVQNDRFLLRWLRGLCLDIRGEDLRHQLNWNSALKIVGQDALSKNLRGRETALREQTVDDAERTALDQALRYLDDPAAAERDMAPYLMETDVDDAPESET